MKTFCKSVLALAAIAIFCLAAMQGTAQEKQKRDRKKGKGPDPIAKMLQGIDLTAEQQAKIDQIKKQYQPKLAEIQKRRDAIMTPDRKRAEKEAKKAAKDAGKTGKEGRLVAEAALNLSPGERGELDAIRKDERQLRGKINEQVRAILTPEQRAKLPEPAKKKRKDK